MSSCNASRNTKSYIHTKALNFYAHFGEAEARVVDNIMKQQKVYHEGVCVCLA